MSIVFIVLSVQIALGALDNLWHHEITERLPAKRGARTELTLHSIREFLYAVIFVGFGWYEWRGLWAWLLAALLMIEISVTITDFLVEDQTRKLPGLERFLHTVLAINFGVFITLLAPIVWQWSLLSTELAPVDHGLWSWFLTAAGIGVFAWSVRDTLAVFRFLRPPPVETPSAETGTKQPPKKGVDNRRHRIYRITSLSSIDRTRRPRRGAYPRHGSGRGVVRPPCADCREPGRHPGSRLPACHRQSGRRPHRRCAMDNKTPPSSSRQSFKCDPCAR